MAVLKLVLLVSLFYIGTPPAASAAAEEQMVGHDVLSSLFHHLKYADPALFENRGPAVENIGRFVKALKTGQRNTYCGLCEGLLRGLELLMGPVWNETAFDAINEVCTVLFEGMGYDATNSRFMCNGTMKFQGPHLHAVLANNATKASPRANCEMLNLCYEPEPAVNRVVLKVVQLTDIHFDPEYAVGTASDCGRYVCCREGYPTGSKPAGAWGSAQCNIPERTMELIIRKMNEHMADGDFVIYAGDSPHHHMWAESYANHYNCSEKLVDAFTRIMPGKRVYPNIGNHEMFPANIYYHGLQDTNSMIHNLTDLWRTVADFQQGQVSTMKTAAYWSMVVKPGLRILSFNSNFLYSYNWYNAKNKNVTQYRDMKTFMETTLRNAFQSHEKVILVGHHPPGNGDGIITENRWLRDLILKYPDLVVLHMAGHTHRNEFKLMYSPSSTVAKHKVHVAPSGTTTPNVNPSMRIYHLDNTTYELLDYEQYYLDLGVSMARNQEPELKKAYAAKEYYGLPDMSPQSWHGLTVRFETDKALFDKYWSMLYTAVPNRECNCTCRLDKICNLRAATYDVYVTCRDNIGACSDPPPSTPTPTPTQPQTGGALTAKPRPLSLVLAVIFLLMAVIHY